MHVRTIEMIVAGFNSNCVDELIKVRYPGCMVASEVVVKAYQVPIERVRAFDYGLCVNRNRRQSVSLSYRLQSPRQ